MSGRRARGFTLIELLVVIAIIAILAAILFPVFARARENARKSNCQSNLKQIGTALMMYVQDYDEYTPASWLGTNDQNGTIWPDLLVPYTKNMEMFNCPSSTIKVGKDSVGKFLRTQIPYACNTAYWGGARRERERACCQPPDEQVDGGAESARGDSFCHRLLRQLGVRRAVRRQLCLRAAIHEHDLQGDLSALGRLQRGVL